MTVENWGIIMHIFSRLESVVKVYMTGLKHDGLNVFVLLDVW